MRGGGRVMDNVPSHAHAHNTIILSPPKKVERVGENIHMGELLRIYSGTHHHLLIPSRNTKTLNTFICFNSIWYVSYLHLDICSSHNPKVVLCHLRQTCTDCLEADIDDSCIWCESHNQCVSKATFDVTFPYLQCMQLLERGTGTCSGQ